MLTGEMSCNRGSDVGADTVGFSLSPIVVTSAERVSLHDFLPGPKGTGSSIIGEGARESKYADDTE